MGNICKPRELVRSPHGVVVQCSDCKNLGVMYRNLILNFHTEEFVDFVRNMNLTSFDQDSKLFADKKYRVLINTCHKNIRMSFEKDELRELQDLLMQAKLMLDVKSLIEF